MSGGIGIMNLGVYEQISHRVEAVVIMIAAPLSV